MSFTLSEIPQNSLYAMAGVLIILLVSTAIYAVLRLTNREKDYTELGLRIRTWWIMIVALFFVMLLSRRAVIIFLAFVSYLALKEFFSIVPIRRVDRRVVFWAYITIPFQYYWVGIGWYGMFIIFIPVYAFLFLPIRMILLGETAGFIRTAGTLHWGTMLAVFSLSHMAYLVALPVANNPIGGSIGLVLCLLFLTQFNDVSQYVWGKTLGRRKITPRISPKKTWAGFLGGVATTTLLGGFIPPLLTPLSWSEGAVAGLLIGISGFFGDLTMSAIKRDLGIKDTGTLLPGHGGILDRVDSLTFTAPLFFHYLYYLHY